MATAPPKFQSPKPPKIVLQPQKTPEVKMEPDPPGKGAQKPSELTSGLGRWRGLAWCLGARLPAPHGMVLGDFSQLGFLGLFPSHSVFGV